MTILKSDRSYEPELQTIATELLAATRENRSLFAQLRDHLRWDDKILAWTMENPNLRVQLFRFIDCLPALKSRSEISRHSFVNFAFRGVFRNLSTFTGIFRRC